MTEITAKSADLISPKAPGTGGKSSLPSLVDPLAFAGAMVGGPLLVGILGIPTFILPFAVIFGGPVYLLVGIPVMLAVMSFKRATTLDWAFFALLTNSMLFFVLLNLPGLSRNSYKWAEVCLTFGTVIAPLWAAVSGSLYRWLERDFYKQSL